jgi:putative endonuclease
MNRSSPHPVQRGNEGERWALMALMYSGYTILARQWRLPGGELDIVARDREGYAFIEVKTRYGVNRGDPAEAVDSRKLRFVHRAAEQWLARHAGTLDIAWRVDVLAIEMHKGLPYRITIHQFYEV